MLESDTITFNYREDEKLLISSWKNCTNTEQFINGIKNCRELCDKIDIQNTLWYFNDYRFVIPPDLQKWTDDFLNAPIIARAKDFKNIVFILGEELLPLLTAVDLFENGSTGVQPTCFTNEQQALGFLNSANKENPLEKQSLVMPNLSFRKDKDDPAKSQILIDINSEEISQ